MSDSKNCFSSDVRVEREGRTYVLTLSEQNALVDRGAYWHGTGDPSSWLAAKTLRRVQEKYKAASEAVAMELAALALGVTVERLQSSVEWNKAYTDWHG